MSRLKSIVNLQATCAPRRCAYSGGHTTLVGWKTSYISLTVVACEYPCHLLHRPPMSLLLLVVPDSVLVEGAVHTVSKNLMMKGGGRMS
jgi:hypothetical protein